MANFAVFAEGLSELDDFAEISQNIRLAATRALNSTADKARTKAARTIRSQINFPASYVAPGQKRLYVSKKATRSDLESRITARTRVTSLARFIQGTAKIGRSGITVSVSPGKSRFMRRAFVLRLPQGSALTDTKFNLGLAIRLRPGEVLQNKVSARRVSSGLYLLYGPSVDQVFRSNDGSGVASDLVPEIERDLSNEFLRLLKI